MQTLYKLRVVFILTACILCAVVASNNAGGETRAARQLGKTSLVFSVIGVIVGIICIIIIVLDVMYGNKSKTHKGRY